MQRATGAALIGTALSATLYGQLAERSAPVLVRYVVDGDTVDVAGVGRVRLLGIDAPELGRELDTPEPFAYEAQRCLGGLLTRR